MIASGMTTLALSELLGATVYDPSGASGSVREVTLAPQEDRSRVSSLIVKTKSGNRILPLAAVSAINGGIRATTAAADWPAANGTEGLFLLERDLLDQQVIDVNGRKVVRVNDVDLQVDGPREKDSKDKDAARIPCCACTPSTWERAALSGVCCVESHRRRRCTPCSAESLPALIPWDFVDVIETDPARRVKLKISTTVWPSCTRPILPTL
jgi:magnesium transporter